MNKPIATVLFVLHMVFFLCITLLMFPGERPAHNIIPLHTMVHDWQHGGKDLFVNFAGNIAVFVPLGVLLPLAIRRPTGVWHVILFSSVFSASVELMQYLSRRRVADVDDILLNTLGAILGYLILTGWRRIVRTSQWGRGKSGPTTALLVLALCLSLLPGSGCGKKSAPDAGVDADRITQVSVINALMLGRYDGIMPVSELLRHGDFGLGTLDHLDGELIILEGRAYQGRGDGHVAEVGPERSTPFAVITFFGEDGNLSCPTIEHLAELDSFLVQALPQKNNFLAIRIDGRFPSITLRSVPRQEPPYKPLGEAAKGQSVWTHNEQVGTLIGIRSPAWVAGLNVPGCHWHFLSSDHTIGGHVLDCQVRDARVSYDVCGQWLLELEETAAFNSVDLGKDLSRDLERVESSRGEEGKPRLPER